MMKVVKMNKLNLDQKTIESCRIHANAIAEKIVRFIDNHTTVSVERSILRLLGVDGVDRYQVPLVNRLVDDCLQQRNCGEGISRYLAASLKNTQRNLADFLVAYQAGKATLAKDPASVEETLAILKPWIDQGLKKIQEQKELRNHWINTYGTAKTQIYVIVATGNIHEDVIQAQAAARAGADIIAVIRSTGQSLLDYVPYGITTEGFGGTYATQANFRLMRQALDEVSKDVGRYIRLVNYASGLCMPEIAAMAALERLDILLNDSLYGIIFRDINMQRTFIDQNFSRLINAYAGILINTGEDNYLTTSDAVEEAHTVLASQFINEAFAKKAHLSASLMGLGHAFEIDPEIENSFLFEIAQAEMAREIFPDAPLKYMPPTKHISGNIFRATMQNALFNLATVMTDQSIHLLGMMTEAIHTPFLSDRFLAIDSAKTIQKTAKSFREAIDYREGGVIHTRACEVLQKAKLLLGDVEKTGLFNALENGVFAGVKRPFQGGKGLEGVYVKDKDYVNPIALRMEEFFR